MPVLRERLCRSSGRSDQPAPAPFPAATGSATIPGGIGIPSPSRSRITMPGVFAFIRCVGQAVVAQGLRGLAGVVPFGEQVYDVAADAFKRWRALPQTDQAALRQELEAAAQSSSGQ